MQAIRGRKAAGHVSRFGYGIGTADVMVKAALEEIGDGFCKRIGGGLGATFDRDAAIKEASNRLVCCQPDAKIEQTATTANFKALLPEGIEAPPHTLMVMRYTLTTGKKDRDGDVLHPDGAEIDPAGPMLWQHLFNLPIGKMLQVVEKSPRRLREIGVLLDLNELTEDCAKLFEAGALRFSHGFQAIDWREMKSEPARYSSGKGRTPGKVGFEVLRYEILERSAVSVPSNADAILELHSRGKLASEVFQKQAKSLMDQRPAQAQGVTLKAIEAEVKVEEVAAKQADEEPEEMEDEAETKTCPKCEAEVPEDATECPECGAKLSGEEEPEEEEEKATVPDQTKAEKWPDPDTVMVCTNAECGYRAPKKFWNPDKMSESGGKFICPKCGAEMKPEGEASPKAATEEPPAKHGRAGIWLTADQLEQVCPDCAKAMRARNLKEINVEALEPDVLRKFLAVKAGRVLSAANVQKLKDCLDDLEELAGMDLPRAAGALAGRIVQTLGALVEAATPAGNEMETEKQATTQSPVTLASLIATASRAELLRVSKTVQAILDVDAIDAAGAQYRELVKC